MIVEKLIKYFIICGLLMLLSPTMAQTIGLSIPDTTMVENEVIDIPVYTDTTLTGSNILSFHLELSYSAYCLEATEIVTTNTLTEGMGDVTMNLTESGKIIVAGAIGSPLTGEGVLFYVRFKAISNGSSNLKITTDGTSYFNEGKPELSVTNGYLEIEEAPEINISSNSGELLVGETLQFTISGDTVAPFTYSVVDTEVASISTDGLLLALQPGKTKVQVEDAEGTVGVTSDDIQIYGFKLSIDDDLSQWQGQEIVVPVTTTDLTDLNIISGSFNLSYNTSVITFEGVVTDTTLLSGGNVQSYADGSGDLSVSFAGASILTGEGTLVGLKFEVSSINTGSTNLNFSDILFNESLEGMTESGKVTIDELADIVLSQDGGTLMAGDSVQVLGSDGVAPYTYVVDNSEIASISDEGMLCVNKGGTVHVVVTDSVGAQKTSEDFIVYDTYVQIPDTTGALNAEFDLPVYMGELPEGSSVSAIETAFSFNASELEFVEVVTSGTLTDGWSFAESDQSGRVALSGAGSEAIESAGILFYLKFNLLDDLTDGEKESVNITDLELNEGSPAVKIISGSITGASIETGIQVMDESSVSVYPNPVQSDLYINCEKITGAFNVKIFNQHGVVVYAKDEQSGAIVINVESFVSGLYIIQISAEEGSWLRKIVVQ